MKTRPGQKQKPTSATPAARFISSNRAKEKTESPAAPEVHTPGALRYDLTRVPAHHPSERNPTSKLTTGEESEAIQPKSIPGKESTVDTATERLIGEMRGSGGRPLPDSERAFFEPRFGRDFGDVRLHTDSRAQEAARSVKAKAFTLGKDIAFGPGEYAPGTSEGRHLLAHELTHTVQSLTEPKAKQGAGASKGSVSPKSNVIRREEAKDKGPLSGELSGVDNSGIYSPLHKYIIFERVSQNFGMGKFTFHGRQAGFDVHKVERRILRLHVLQKFKKGRPPTLWEQLKHWLDIEKIQLEKTGVVKYVLAYSGGTNYVEVGGVRVRAGKQWMAFGSDPIEKVALYGNPKFKFVSDQGGKGSPYAYGFYDDVSKKLEQIPPARAQKMITDAKK